MKDEGRVMNGRQRAWFFYDFFKIGLSELMVSEFDDLLNCEMKNTNLQAFWHDWEYCIEGQKNPTPAHILESLFRTQLNKDKTLELALATYDHGIAHNGDKKSYDKLVDIVIIELEARRQRRHARDLKRQGGNARASRDGRRGNADARSESKRDRQDCRAFWIYGKCARGDRCQFNHDRVNPDGPKGSKQQGGRRSRQGTPRGSRQGTPRGGRSPRGGNRGDRSPRRNGQGTPRKGGTPRGTSNGRSPRVGSGRNSNGRNSRQNSPRGSSRGAGERKKKVCFFYMKGNCKNYNEGKPCSFEHPRDCKFDKEGTCKNSWKTCNFFHRKEVECMKAGRAQAAKEREEKKKNEQQRQSSPRADKPSTPRGQGQKSSPRTGQKTPPAERRAPRSRSTGGNARIAFGMAGMLALTCIIPTEQLQQRAVVKNQLVQIASTQEGRENPVTKPSFTSSLAEILRLCF